MDWKLFLTVFASIFVAEMADKTQLVTLLFAADKAVSKWVVFLGSASALVLASAIGLMAVGYIGLFFGRWIKAALSRQREYLADASAVQFTRDPNGIGGAWKKIAIYSDASYLNVDTEEISHMLFGDGQKMSMFSTHPPMTERIQRIDKSFKPDVATRPPSRGTKGRNSRANICNTSKIIHSVLLPD